MVWNGLRVSMQNEVKERRPDLNLLRGFFRALETTIRESALRAQSRHHVVWIYCYHLAVSEPLSTLS